MKSIFNRGMRLNSLQSAETILKELIFNGEPLCMRAKCVKYSEMPVSAKENKLDAKSYYKGEKGLASSPLPSLCSLREMCTMHGMKKKYDSQNYVKVNIAQCAFPSISTII